MIPFRKKTPKRRKITTKVSTWGKHKPELRKDFKQRCGYCDSNDFYKHTYYEVDHFIPKGFFLKNGNIGLTDYYNLTYSCKFCNNNKSNKWPTQSEIILNNGKEGFIDACDDEYAKQFYRTTDGKIVWITDLGKWMFEKFKFGERERALQLLWNLDRLKSTIEELERLLTKINKQSEDYKNTLAKIKDYTYIHYTFEGELKSFYE
jgi:hypothetical protein